MIWIAIKTSHCPDIIYHTLFVCIYDYMAYLIQRVVIRWYLCSFMNSFKFIISTYYLHFICNCLLTDPLSVSVWDPMECMFTCNILVYSSLSNFGVSISKIITTRVGTLKVATIYLQLIQNRYMFRSFTVLQCSHQHCLQPVASDVEVVGYL